MIVLQFDIGDALHVSTSAVSVIDPMQCVSCPGIGDLALWRSVRTLFLDQNFRFHPDLKIRPDARSPPSRHAQEQAFPLFGPFALESIFRRRYPSPQNGRCFPSAVATKNVSWQNRRPVTLLFRRGGG